MEVTDCPVCGNPGGRAVFLARDKLLGKPGEFREVRCPECGLLYLNPRPIPERMAQFYAGSYAPHEKKPKPARLRPPLLKKILAFWYRGSDLRTRLKKNAYPGPKGKVLDLGCGSGAFLHRLRELGWETHGVEIDTRAAAAARKLGLDVRTGTLRQAGFSDGYFDVLTVIHVLEHIHRPVAFLKEAWRVLKPGGILYVEVPNLISFNFRLFGRNWFHLDAPRHLCSYWKKPLTRLLRMTGFRILRTRFASGTVGLRGSIQYSRRSRGCKRLELLDSKTAKRLLGLFTFALDIARLGDVIRVDAVKVRMRSTA